MPSTSRRTRTLVLCLGLLAPVACADPPTVKNPNSLKYSEDAKKAYKAALQVFLNRDWDEARVLLARVKREYAYSRWARLAELRMADIDFEQEKYAASITSYRSFSKAHRTDESVPYARYRIALALHRQISDTVLLPAQEERDQASTLDAYRELRVFLKDYPRSKWAPEARFMLLDVTGRLARHELYVARYYLRRDNFEAAAGRAQYCLENYDGSGLEPEAMVLLGEIYLKMKKWEKAERVLKLVVDVYSDSPFSEAAKRYLKEALSKKATGLVLGGNPV